MNIVRTGVILNTEYYDQCVAFYRDLFGLRILFQDRDIPLACFEYGGSYLMVETDGFGMPAGKSARENATKPRFNVSDIDAALETVRTYGVDAEIVANEWGRTIDIQDPDGNRIGIRDETTFNA